MRSPAYLVAEPPAVVANSEPFVTTWWRLTQPSSLLLYPGLRFLDFICGPLVLAAVLMAGNSQRMPSGLASFLSIRITVKNLVLLGAFLLGWWLVFAASNLYHNSKLRSIVADFTAVFQTCSLGALMVVVFCVTSKSG